MTKSGAGRKSLKKYEVANLLFFVGLILALGIVVTFVFRSYGNRNNLASSTGEKGIVSTSLSDTSDIGIFYLGTQIYDTSHRFRSPMDIPVTDDGFLKELFAIPGVLEITVDKRSIMIKKATSASWEDIHPRVQEAVMRHLHLHY